MKPRDVSRFEECISSGGVAVFPTDTLYGLGCDPSNERAIERVYSLKGRPPEKLSAVMYFTLEAAVSKLAEFDPTIRDVARRLLPGPMTLVLPGGFGLRVPRLERDLAELARVRVAVLQTSANLAGGDDPRRVDQIPQEIRLGADLVLDGGELPGTASTVVDLRRYEDDRSWELLREGAVAREWIAKLLTG